MSILYGDEHVRRYRETDGEEGHIWQEGSTVLLLTTKGRKTGNETTTPLIYDFDDHNNPVIVASKGGAPEHPGWYLNLTKDPEVARCTICSYRFTLPQAGSPLFSAP